MGLSRNRAGQPKAALRASAPPPKNPRNAALTRHCPAPPCNRAAKAQGRGGPPGNREIENRQVGNPGGRKPASRQGQGASGPRAFSWPSPFAFHYKILLIKQAIRPQRPSILRSALSIQEKSVDNLGIRCAFKAGAARGGQVKKRPLFSAAAGNIRAFCCCERFSI